MKLTGMEIPSIYKNVYEYLIFDYTDEIQLGKELCSVRLIRLETADLFKNKIPHISQDEEISQENYIAVIAPADNTDNLIGKSEFISSISDFIISEMPGLSAQRLEISIKQKDDFKY